MSLIVKYQLDFQNEIYEYQIPEDEKNMNVVSFLEKINKKENRSDLKYVVIDNSHISEEEIADFIETDKIFIIYGDFVEFNLYINIDISSMRDSTKIKLKTNSTEAEICDEIRKTIPQEKSRFNPFKISFYVSGGIKIETDLVNFLITYRPVKLNLYAVITPLVELSTLKSRLEFLTPYNLSKVSGSNIACLTEYIHLDGSKSMDLMTSIASIVNFAPIPMIFLSLMQKGLTREPFFHIISLLQTIFLGIDPSLKPETVFEKTPYFCKYICSQYSNKNFICKVNNTMVFGPDLLQTVPNPLNDLWQPPTKESIYLNNSDFHVFPTNSIIRSDCPCFAKKGLLLIEKKYQKNIFFNPLTKEVIEKQVDLNGMSRTLTARDTRIDIKNSNVKQLMIILIDLSEHIKTENLEQIEKSILKNYNNNACRFRFLSLNAMMSYGIHTLVLSKMDTYDQNFAFRSRSAQIGGKSNIYKAINDSVDYLNAFNWNENVVAFPNAQYRIVLVSSGYNDDDDEQSVTFSYEDTKEKLSESNIILDSFIMKKSSPFNKTIAKLCHFTGGSCIIVDNEEKSKNILSQEAFLNIDFRKHHDFGDDSCDTCDTEFPNSMKIEGEMKQKLITVDKSLPKPSNDLTRRILQEYKYIQSLNEKSFSVFMVKDNICEWRVFLKAPPKANLDEKWFYLLICFPTTYPIIPPSFKFISIPYHINISNEGRICLNYLDYDYNSSLTVAYLIICILGLLESPNYDDPIDMEVKKMYTDDRNKFLEKVKESAKLGKDSVDDWINEIQG